jgi:hypothetical protein
VRILLLCKLPHLYHLQGFQLTDSVAKSTGIPVSNLLKGERERLVHVSGSHLHLVPADI